MAQLIVAVVLAALVVQFIGEHLGLVLAVVGIAVVVAVAGSVLKARRAQEKWRRYGVQRGAAAKPLWILERQLQNRMRIFAESLDLMLNSKKRRTIEGRIGDAERALDLIEELGVDASGLRRSFEHERRRARTRMYLVDADEHYQKALTLKTQRGRNGRVDKAVAAIREGMADPSADRAALGQWLVESGLDEQAGQLHFWMALAGGLGAVFRRRPGAGVLLGAIGGPLGLLFVWALADYRQRCIDCRGILNRGARRCHRCGSFQARPSGHSVSDSEDEEDWLAAGDWASWRGKKWK
ncbi:MAG: hypothetical protein ACQEXJ_18960 [Myxococcota bacterium]